MNDAAGWVAWTLWKHLRAPGTYRPVHGVGARTTGILVTT